jgi:hypothetical protein
MSALGQAPTVGWARQISGAYVNNYNTLVGTTAMDGEGDVYFVGGFSASVFTIGAQLLTNCSASPNSLFGQDGFIAKYSPKGDLLWVRQIGGNGLDVPSACTVDKQGNVFVTGYFSSTNLLLGTNVLSSDISAGVATDMFLVKYDSEGNVLWTQQATGTGNEIGTGLAADSSGNLFLIGCFNSTNTVIGTNALSNPDSTESVPKNQDFLAKFDPDGGLVWTRQVMISAGGQKEPLVGVDGNGNVYITDSFYTTADFGGPTLTNSSGTNGQTIFIAKYDPAGNLAWSKEAVRSVGAANTFATIYPHGFAVGPQGDSRIAGAHDTGSAIFSTGSVTASGYQGGFLASYDASGNCLWANKLNASGNEWAASLALDPMGNSYVTCTSGGTFVFKHSAAGALLWSRPLAGDGGSACSTDSHGNVFVFGQASVILNFDGIIVNPAGNTPYYFAAMLNGPSVKIGLSGGHALISWPTNAVGLNLETATDIAGMWSPVTNAPAVLGSDYSVTNAVIGLSRFYRLRNF